MLDPRAMVEATPAEGLPRLIGDLEAARAAAWARLASPAAGAHPTEDRLLRMPAVAARLGITEHQARELGRRGKLPVVRVGERRVRVSARARRVDSGPNRPALLVQSAIAMACIRKRRGRWVLDYRDKSGVRRWETYPTREEAEDRLAKVIPDVRARTTPVLDSNISLAEYARHWLEVVRGSLKHSTHQLYRQILEGHILPEFGAAKVRKLRRGPLKTFLAEKLTSGLSRDSVRLIHATLRVVLNGARDDDEIIVSNPAEGLSRTLRLVRSHAARQEEIKALDREQLSRLLEATAKRDIRLYPLLLTLARTGMRMGEALALQWDDIDCERREIRIARAFSLGELSTPKSGHGRSVDMSAQLVSVLRDLGAREREAALRRGVPEEIAWVFPSEAGTRLDHHNVAKRFRRVLKAAGLAGRFHLHCLRHTFASLLLADGASPAYVQEQLGHA